MVCPESLCVDYYFPYIMHLTSPNPVNYIPWILHHPLLRQDYKLLHKLQIKRGHFKHLFIKYMQ